MQDQVAKYGERSLKAAFVGRDQTDEGVNAGVERGDYQLVYMSPESMLAVISGKSSRPSLPMPINKCLQMGK